MSDFELLELAGKAAWRALGGRDEDRQRFFAPTLWNPLEHDGDALRLSVALGMTVEINPAGPFTAAIAKRQDCVEWHKEHSGDACAATRRAIVRAAAEAQE